MDDNGGQQLVLQAHLCHAKVHERRLRGNFGAVVRVGELGVQVEAKVRVVLYLGVANFKKQAAPTPNDLLADDGIQHCINVFRQVLQQQGHAVLYTIQHLLVTDQCIELAMYKPLLPENLGFSEELHLMNFYCISGIACMIFKAFAQNKIVQVQAHLVDVVRLRLLQNLEAVGCLACDEPAPALQLWIDDQRPAGGIGDDGAVL